MGPVLIVLIVVAAFAVVAGIVVFLFLKYHKKEEIVSKDTLRHFTGKYINDSDKSMCELDLYYDNAWFFDDPNEFNPRLCTLSCILSELSYSLFTIALNEEDNEICNSKTPYKFLKSIGFDNISQRDKNILFYFARQKITNENETKNLILVDIRGTIKLEEWLSNLKFIEDANGCHTGFSETKKILRAELDDYLRDHNIPADNTVFWIVGHSRGAAVANLLGADLRDEARECFVYTFACPHTTKNDNKDIYNCIFNVVNQDDVVVALPVGKKRYGAEHALSVKSLYKNQNKIDYGDLTSTFDYKNKQIFDKDILRAHSLMAYYAICLYLERNTIVVNPCSKTKCEGSVDPELTYTASCRTDISNVLHGSLSRVSGEEEGKYSILQGTLELTDNNYNIIFKTGRKLTIQKRTGIFPLR